jgi:hypothetical protein
MRKPPYNVAFQEGTWAITEMAENVKDDMRKNNTHPNDPWIIHYCNWHKAQKRWWNVVLELQGEEVRTHQCSECGNTPPDKILTIWRLYV